MVTKPKKNLKNVRSKGFTIEIIISEESLTQHQLCTYKVCIGYLHLFPYFFPFSFCHFSKVTSNGEPRQIEA
jgi:hypothetical protein